MFGRDDSSSESREAKVVRSKGAYASRVIGSLLVLLLFLPSQSPVSRANCGRSRPWRTAAAMMAWERPSGGGSERARERSVILICHALRGRATLRRAPAAHGRGCLVGRSTTRARARGSSREEGKRRGGSAAATTGGECCCRALSQQDQGEEVPDYPRHSVVALVYGAGAASPVTSEIQISERYAPWWRTGGFHELFRSPAQSGAAHTRRPSSSSSSSSSSSFLSAVNVAPSIFGNGATERERIEQQCDWS